RPARPRREGWPVSETIVIRCPGCGRQFERPAEPPDRPVTCPACQTAFQMPGAVASPALKPSGGGLPPIAKYGIVGGVALIILVGVALAVTSDRAKLGGTWKLKSFGGRAVPPDRTATMELGRFSNKATVTTPGFIDQSRTHVLTGEYETGGGRFLFKIIRGDIHDTPAVAGDEAGAEISELTWSTLRLKVGRANQVDVLWEKE
ncbi:MAG TPA: hypothetical protein VF796_21255, partial [Humisphaera sp.]